MSRVQKIRRVLADFGRVIDPPPVRRVESGRSGGMLGPVWRLYRRQEHIFRMSRARSRLQGRVRDYTEQGFAAETGPDVFRSFLGAYEDGDHTKLREVCTEGFLERVMAGRAVQERELGGIRAMRLGAVLEAAQLVHYGLGWDQPAARRRFNDEPSFAQVTLKLVTEQRPVFVSSGRSKQPKVKGGVTQDGVWWEPIECAESSEVYFAERVSGTTSWEAPPALGLVQAAPPFRMDRYGLERQVLEPLEPLEMDSLPTTEQTPQDRLRVTNVVCFERALRTPGAGTSSALPTDSKWRIAAFLDWC